MSSTLLSSPFIQPLLHSAQTHFTTTSASLLIHEWGFPRLRYPTERSFVKLVACGASFSIQARLWTCSRVTGVFPQKMSAHSAYGDCCSAVSALLVTNLEGAEAARRW